ncbi:PTS system IIA component (Fru family) [Streptohalobacillus salinus]|uniref:PTS system IIA component (Fru family) n=1 Tax=Streptohalobacillus salinus TaxID=621096 RepID=A0A2V3W9B4_9BACI|nr:PTS system IIA component (Fru family) [Streptohalobacillus salinus]
MNLTSLDEDKLEVISERLISVDCHVSTREEALKYLITQVKQENYVDDGDRFFQAVMEREKEASTAIGDLIAIPHGKTDVVKRPFVAFLRSDQAFRWSDASTEAAQLIFLIGVPKESESKLHLKIISELSKKLLDEAFKEKLMTYTNPKEIYALLNAINV